MRSTDDRTKTFGIGDFPWRDTLLAELNHWGESKRERMLFLLNYFNLEDINPPAIIDAYALIDTYSIDRGIRMGKNDIWIAATAHATGATLVTTDQDFDHLHDKFLNRVWVAPTA